MIVQCERLHYYDSAKSAVCPYCLKQDSASVYDAGDDLREQRTVYVEPAVLEDQLTEAYGEAVGEGDKTISLYADEMENQFTVGWLVCMNGPAKGKSYALHKGYNFAGRSIDMDIVLSDDLLLSNEKHFSVVYDQKSNRFYIIAGTGNTTVNGARLTGENKLSEGDMISVGASALIFIPFCRVGRTW